MNLSDPVTTLIGVGKELERKLKRLNVITINDLIHCYPRRYDDFSKITKIAQAKPGTITIKGMITRAATRRTRRRGFTITEAIVDDDTGAIKAVWFNQPYLAKGLPKDVPVFVSGSLEFSYDQYALQNPIVERVSSFTKNTARIVPVYPETEGISSRQIRSMVERVLPVVQKLEDGLPNSIIKGQKLMSYADALAEIHFPSSSVKLEQARHRLGFEELFMLVLTGLVIKSEIKVEKAPVIKFDAKVAKDFVGSLPFKLTNAQRKAAWQILQDINSQEPMNRLLEGDVGSGKTVVAAMAAAMAIHNGYQVALMAPTEILAAQHYVTLSNLLSGSIAYLSSSTKAAEKRSILAELESGATKLVVGTHALLQPEVGFKNLGLVIIDEQHRFGVNQRLGLKAKAKRMPHLLSMSATPIPRSLALTVYGDLDITILGELPPGRQPVKTKVASESVRADIYHQVDELIGTGQQVYVVCPLISESDKLGIKSVEAESARLKNSVFKHRQIAVLNGRMKTAEKQVVMDGFKSGKVDILVSTTVVEVGVDVPNANIMLIEGAERFGLATLHQLRGRVGRGKNQAYCYLLTTNDRTDKARLQLMEKYNDGFILAQKDLELRGPGAIYGTRQHGLLDLKIANLADTKLISQARLAAENFFSDRTILSKYPKLMAKVKNLQKVTSLD